MMLTVEFPQANKHVEIPPVIRIYSRIMRILKLNSGLTPTAFNKLTNRLLFPLKGKVETTTSEGVVISVDPNDYHGRVLLIHGTNDRKVARVACSLAREGDIFLDIGANYSTIGLSVSRIVGNSGRVHLFEPQPHLAEVVQAAIDAAGISNVELHRIALFEEDGELTLRMPFHHSGMATLVDRVPIDQQWNEIVVETRDTNKCIREIVGNRTFCVKIDVEGAEPVILTQLFKFNAIRYCVFEGCNNEKWLFDAFKNANFVIYGLERNIFRCALRKVESFDRWHDFHDFVAVRNQQRPLPDHTTPHVLATLIQ